MPFNKYRNAGRRIPRKARMASRRRRSRKPMTTGRVKRIIDAELKVKDVAANGLNPDNLLGSLVRLSDVAVGDANNQRTGNWIKPVSLMGTITIQGVDNLVDRTTKCRISIVCWKENQDADNLVLARILQDVAQPHQQYNIESKGSFKILWSRTFTLINKDENAQFLRTFRFYVKPSMKVLFDGADARKYHLFLVASSDKVALSGDEPVMDFNTRLRYTDS